MNAKLKKKIFWIFIIHNLAFSIAFADFEFLGVGARPTGFANCYSALSDDIYGIYYNPGGITFAPEYPEITAEYSRLWLNLTDNSNLSNGFIGYLNPLKDKSNSKLALSIQYFSLIGFYTENIFTVAYSRKLSKLIGFGVNLKNLYQSYSKDDYIKQDPVFDYGKKTDKSLLSIDSGLMWNFFEDYFLGISLLNLNQPDIGFGQKELLPMTLNFAVAYRRNYRTLNDFNFAIGITQTGNDRKFNTGIEKWFSNATWGLRTGFAFGSNQFYSFALGGSIRYKTAQIDYSLALPVGGIQETWGTHRLSLTYRFGPLIVLEAISIEEYKAERAKLIIEHRKEIKELSDKIVELETKLQEAQQLPLTPSDIDKLNNRIKSLETELKDTKDKLRTAEEALKKVTEEVPVRPAPTPSVVQPKPAPPPTPPAPIRTHKVLEGDSLPSIAKRYYGDSSQWKKIYEANKDKIKRGQVEPGTVLIIP